MLLFSPFRKNAVLKVFCHHSTPADRPSVVTFNGGLYAQFPMITTLCDALAQEEPPSPFALSTLALIHEEKLKACCGVGRHAGVPMSPSLQLQLIH